jgi:hypothetical protein
MKLKVFILFVTSVCCVFSQDSQNYNRSGDPSDRSWPGGYVSIAYEFDLKSKQKGYQVSFGVAVPGIGESGNGPFIFPGIVFGKRYLLNEDQSYSYIDLQVVAMIGGVWGGGGYGSGNIDGKKHKRRKYFIGWLPGGYVNESTQTANSDWQKGTFKGYHFGLAFPLIGNHFYP